MSRPPKKKGDWKTLVTLGRKYDKHGRPMPGPVVQTTYTRSDGMYLFSHTPGIATVDGSFRPVQHLHDRHGEAYVLLLMDALMAVARAKQIGIEQVEASPEVFEKDVRVAQSADSTLESVEQTARAVVRRGRSRGRSGHQKREPDKPTLKASLGDMMKAKQGQ